MHAAAVDTLKHTACLLYVIPVFSSQHAAAVSFKVVRDDVWFTIAGARQEDWSAPSWARIIPVFQEFSPKTHSCSKTRGLNS